MIRSYSIINVLACFTILLCLTHGAFISISSSSYCRRINMVRSNSQTNDNSESESRRLKAKAEELRQQIRKLEEQLSTQRKSTRPNPIQVAVDESVESRRTLRNKRILVVGANGRLGSMVVRYLLRNHPEIAEVVAAVHYVGTASTRGYGRLSYEVGAEDGIGTIGPIWNADDREATFMYSDEMKPYNLQKLRVVQAELLDPVECSAITQGVDSVIWCATDFNGNTPRSISTLDAGLLFRAVVDVTKGRVEIEGLTNILGALYQSKLNTSRMKRVTEPSASLTLDPPGNPISFVLISPSPLAFSNFETPLGEFNGLKRQGERILQNEFPSLTYCVLQMSKFEDNFVQESLDIQMEMNIDNDPLQSKRRIHRRDAARAAVEALLDDNLVGKVTRVWTVQSR